MPILRAGTVLDAYRIRASMPSLHALTGRPDPSFTKMVVGNILSMVQPQPSDVLLDVGCGDGSLMRQCDCRGIGILPSPDECRRLKSAHPELDVRVGLAQQLPLPDACTTKVVCNGVFIYLSGTEALRALQEIARVAAPGALVYIGELPDVDELANTRRKYGTSIWRWLNYLRQQSLRHLAAGLRDLAVAAVTNKAFFLEPPDIYFVQPEHFISLAAGSGLEHLQHFRRQEPGGPSSTRFEYLFRKS